jgi:hypothetical protein
VSYVALYTVYQTHALYYRYIDDRNPQEETLMVSREENKCEDEKKSHGQPRARKARSDCSIRQPNHSAV